jgi:serine phosphatase RsbU (regulator of sigma subunit)
VYCKPYQDAVGGGDVYYVSSCATGRVTRLLVADVSGHGDAVRETAIALRGMMRRYVNHIDQSSFVRSMNKQFGILSNDGSFATALVTTFFAPTNYLTLCNAGHPPPLLYRAHDQRWTFLEEAGNIPLGIDDGTEYAQFGVELAMGDFVLCHTDSLTESRGGDGEFLGEAGLLRVVEKLDVSDPAKIIPQLLERIAQLWPGNLTEDDVTALLFRPNGRGAHVPWRNKLLAPLRVLRGLFRRGEPIAWPEFSLVNIGGAMLDPLNRVWSGRRKRR